MNARSIDELDGISTALLSDVSEDDHADPLWDDLSEEDHLATYAHGSEHRCRRCLFAVSRTNLALSACSELESDATSHAEFWRVLSPSELQYSELSLDFAHMTEALEQHMTTAPVAETESREERSVERPATILGENKLFNRTMNGVLYTACVSVVLILGGFLWESTITVLIGVCVFLIAAFAWLACFTWMGWIFIRFTRQRGWSWLKQSNNHDNHPH